MRCMSCGANIPPEWVNAIQSNICPGCGGEIMGEPTKELLKELTEAMRKMPNDPQGVAGWLLSNYRFQKVGAADPVEKFHRKGGAPIDESNLKIDPSYNEFIKRNNATDLVQKSNELARIKNNGGKLGELASMIQNVGDPYGDDLSVNDGSQNIDPDDIRAQMDLRAAGIDVFAGNNVGGITDVSQAIRPSDIMGFLNQREDVPLKEELALSQTPEGRSYLQRDRHKKLKAQDAVSGGGGGVFRR